MFTKYIESDIVSIIKEFLKKDFSLLPGRNGERFIWSLVEVGVGNLRDGFSTCYCKGKSLICVDDFCFDFIAGKIKSNKNKLIRISLFEFGVEIRREFQLNIRGVVPVSRVWLISHKDDALKYELKLIRKGGEKIGLPN